MAISEELTKMLKMALKELSNHSKSELVLPIRKRIWALLGTRLINEESRAIYGTGLYRRAFLAKLCTQHVLNVWESDWLTHQGPQQMLSIAEEYLKKQLDYDFTWEQMNQFWGELDNLSNNYDYKGSINVGYAAANVVAVALNDEQFEPNDVEDNQFLDEDYDPYDWDTRFYASMAYANGEPGNENSNPQYRKQFWEWYIKEAIPLAWEASNSYE